MNLNSKDGPKCFAKPINYQPLYSPPHSALTCTFHCAIQNLWVKIRAMSRQQTHRTHITHHKSVVEVRCSAALTCFVFLCNLIGAHTHVCMCTCACARTHTHTPGPILEKVAFLLWPEVGRCQ